MVKRGEGKVAQAGTQDAPPTDLRRGPAGRGDCQLETEPWVTAYRRKLKNTRMAHRQEAQRLAIELAASGASKVILFGSVAQGQDSFSSDLDLVAITDSVRGVPFHQRIADALLRLNPSMQTDLLIYTAEEWDGLCSCRRFVQEEILEKGVVLYERP